MFSVKLHEVKDKYFCVICKLLESDTCKCKPFNCSTEFLSGQLGFFHLITILVLLSFPSITIVDECFMHALVSKLFLLHI